MSSEADKIGVGYLTMTDHPFQQRLDQRNKADIIGQKMVLGMANVGGQRANGFGRLRSIFRERRVGRDSDEARLRQ